MFRDLLDESAGPIHLFGLTPKKSAAQRIGEVEGFLGASESHIAKTAFFLQVVLGHRSTVWEEPLLTPHQKNNWEFQTLGVVQGHQTHRCRLVVIVCFRAQGSVIEKFLKGITLFAVFPAQVDQFFKIENPVVGLLGILTPEMGHISACFQDFLEHQMQRQVQKRAALGDDFKEAIQCQMGPAREGVVLQALDQSFPESCVVLLGPPVELI